MAHEIDHDEQMTERLNLRLPPSLARALASLARHLDVPQAQLLRALLVHSVSICAWRTALLGSASTRRALALRRRRRR